MPDPVEQLFVATHSSLFDLDPTGFLDVSHDDTVGTVVRRRRVVGGYRDRLRSDWSFEGLPARVGAALDALVTRVTSLLAAGVDDDATIRRALADDVDALTVAVDAEGADGRVVVFAAGLLADLVVRR